MIHLRTTGHLQLLHMLHQSVPCLNLLVKHALPDLASGSRTRVSFKRYALGLREVQSCQEYLDYCRATDASLNSAVFRGTMYELAAKHMLVSHFHCFNLTRSGGAGDYGVDIFGRWNLLQYPCVGKASAASLAASSDIDLATGVAVLVQCKNHSGKIGAAVVRELGGIYDFHVKTRAARQSTFLFLVSPEPLTRQAQAQLDIASIPMAHMRMRAMLPIAQNVYDIESWTGGEVVSAYLNRRARKLLQGLDVERKMTQFLF